MTSPPIVCNQIIRKNWSLLCPIHSWSSWLLDFLPCNYRPASSNIFSHFYHVVPNPLKMRVINVKDHENLHFWRFKWAPYSSVCNSIYPIPGKEKEKPSTRNWQDYTRDIPWQKHVVNSTNFKFTFTFKFHQILSLQISVTNTKRKLFSALFKVVEACP